jgi:hypothetical protein
MAWLAVPQMIAPPATGIGVSLYHNCPYPAGFLTKISASSGMETDNVKSNIMKFLVILATSKVFIT